MGYDTRVIGGPKSTRANFKGANLHSPVMMQSLPELCLYPFIAVSHVMPTARMQAASSAAPLIPFRGDL